MAGIQEWFSKERTWAVPVLLTLLIVMLLLFIEQLVVGSSYSEGKLSREGSNYKDLYLYNIMSGRVLYTEVPRLTDFLKLEKKAESFAPPSTIALSVRNGTGEHNNSWGACTTGAVYGSDSLAANITSSDSQQNFKTSSHKQGFSDNDLAAQL